MLATITAGKAKTTMAAKTSMAQAKIGMRPSVIPGARQRRMPTISSIAPAMAEISMKPMPSRYMSVLMPGECSLLVSGGYMNQPPSGAAPKNSEEKKASPPIT